MTKLFKINIEEFSSFRELGLLRDLFNSYLNNHTKDFFIKKIGYNNGTAEVFLIDDNGNYWKFDVNNLGKLRMMTKEEKEYNNYRSEK